MRLKYMTMIWSDQIIPCWPADRYIHDIRAGRTGYEEIVQLIEKMIGVFSPEVFFGIDSLAERIRAGIAQQSEFFRLNRHVCSVSQAENSSAATGTLFIPPMQTP